jgi:hypothetical protein
MDLGDKKSEQVASGLLKLVMVKKGITKGEEMDLTTGEFLKFLNLMLILFNIFDTGCQTL